MKRFRIGGSVCALALACLCSRVPAEDSGRPLAADASIGLQQELDALAEQAGPGSFGIAVLDLRTGAEAKTGADRAYPMMSVFKAPVAAAVLARIDAGQLSLARQVVVTRSEVAPGAAVPSIGAHFRGERMRFTVDQLLVAAVSQSDNTAVDALIRLLGGPAAVTGFLRVHGIQGMRVDLDEAGVNRLFEGVAHGENVPSGETPEAGHERYRRGFADYLADPRNRSTPDAAVDFLRKLWRRQLLSEASTRRLLDLMYGQVVPARLRAGLPAGVKLADKCGTSPTLDDLTPAYNDIGILTGPDGHTVIVAAFLSASRAGKGERDALFATLARRVAAAMRL